MLNSFLIPLKQRNSNALYWETFELLDQYRIYLSLISRPQNVFFAWFISLLDEYFPLAYSLMYGKQMSNRSKYLLLLTPATLT